MTATTQQQRLEHLSREFDSWKRYIEVINRLMHQPKFNNRKICDRELLDVIYARLYQYASNMGDEQMAHHMLLIADRLCGRHVGYKASIDDIYEQPVYRMVVDRYHKIMRGL